MIAIKFVDVFGKELFGFLNFFAFDGECISDDFIFLNFKDTLDRSE